MLLFAKTFVGIGFQLAFFAALMFLPIGTTGWPAAITWLAVYAFVSVLSAIYLLVVRPGAIEARMRAGRKKQTPADRLALGFMVLALMLPIIVAALDVFFWQLLPDPGPLVQAIGMVIFLTGFLIVLLAMLHNEFAAPTVHIQEDAGHVLADGGVYAYVRHPMYAGFLVIMVGTTLWLASYAATALATIMIIASTIYRIGIEEATLKEELPGYGDYMKRVKTRFLPLIY
ncbi:MAG: isoprenylcysteine carboxylmethyltransferase family protein [Parvularculales bacterium]